jgi:membrane fusion protein, multidrug efflux system
MGDSDAKAVRAKRFRILASVLTATAFLAGGWWFSGRNHETTDDSFVDSDIIQISPQVGGRVVAVHFGDYAQVNQGDLLVELDPRDTEATAAAARANVDAARARARGAEAALALTRVTSGADYTKAESAMAGAQQQVGQARSTAEAAHAEASRAAADAERYRELFAGHNASRQRMEQAQADARMTQARWRATQAAVANAEANVAQAVAQRQSANTAAQQIALKVADLALATAQVEQAEAALRTAELNLSYTRITAPLAGRMTRKAVNVGDSVQKDQVMSQEVTGTPWIIANFKENQLSRMRLGQKTAITIDAYPDLKLTGHVDSIQPGTGARFSLLPAENATGNFVKVVQRVPVKIVLDAPLPAEIVLAPGMSAMPDVDVGR